MTSRIRAAVATDVSVILNQIRQLADFEELSRDVVATEELLRATLFSSEPSAQVLVIEANQDALWLPAGFALYFTSYSTFLARPGIYLEDLFILPEYRSRGYGKLLLARLAQICLDKSFGRLEWSVLDWNTRARAFYERQGAVAMQDWTVHRVAGAALTKLASSGELT